MEAVDCIVNVDCSVTEEICGGDTAVIIPRFPLECTFPRPTETFVTSFLGVLR